MAEDQGVNGDLWNDEASTLMKHFNWNQVGDGNIDVYNEDNKPHGIDRIFTYFDVKRSVTQAVFLEAKRYLTTSFSKSSLQEWVKVIDNKLNKTKNSQLLYDTYPALNRTVLRIGIIAIWFHDTDKYSEFKNSYDTALTEIKPPARLKDVSVNRIYILDNYYILKLASLYSAIERYEFKNKTKIKFFYPSTDKFNNASDTSETLSIEYIYSKIILAEAVCDDGKENKIVFYFGSLTTNSFKRLKSFLQMQGYFDKRKPLSIYYYQRDQEFRKIKPDVSKEFEEVVHEFKEMDLFSDLPSFLKP